MHAANEHAHCYFALIDSHTLRTDGFYTLLSDSRCRYADQFSVHALIGRFSSADRRRFIIALNTNSGFASTITEDNKVYRVELYSTDHFGASWSHLLVLCRLDYYPHITFQRHTEASLIEILITIHDYNRHAASSFIEDSPAAAKKYIEYTAGLIDRLFNLLCEQLL